MDFQADIKCSITELNQVNDGNLDKALDLAINDAEEVKVKSHEDIREKYAKWL